MPAATDERALASRLHGVAGAGGLGVLPHGVGGPPPRLGQHVGAGGARHKRCLHLLRHRHGKGSGLTLEPKLIVRLGAMFPPAGGITLGRTEASARDRQALNESPDCHAHHAQVQAALDATYEGDVYFEAASLILTFVCLGKWMEARAKARTSDVVASLLNLAPRTAVLLTVHPKSGAAAFSCVGEEGREGRGGFPAQPGAAHGGAADGAPQVRCGGPLAVCGWERKGGREQGWPPCSAWRRARRCC